MPVVVVVMIVGGTKQEQYEWHYRRSHGREPSIMWEKLIHFREVVNRERDKTRNQHIVWWWWFPKIHICTLPPTQFHSCIQVQFKWWVGEVQKVQKGLCWSGQSGQKI